MRNLHRPLQIFLWSFVVIYVVSCSLQITQIDIWWQLTEGAQILRTWALPTTPVLAFGIPASPYFNEYAGYEVVLALLYKIGGFPGLWLIFTAVYLLIIFLPGTISGRKYPAFNFSSTVALLFAGILMKDRMEQRPELVGALLQVVLMVTLYRSRLEIFAPRKLVAIFLVFLVWTNTHSTFVIGLFTMGVWAACEFILKIRQVPFPQLSRGALAMFGTALVALMLNPYGPRRLLFPFTQAFDPGSTALSTEMWPIDVLATPAGVLVIIAIALIAWEIIATRRVPLWLILFSIFSVCISLEIFRFIYLLAISVLFVYAARQAPADEAKSSHSLPLLLLANTGLSCLCLFMLYWAAFSFVVTYGEMKTETELAVHTRRFAPSVYPSASDSKIYTPVLCDQGLGSYLSFPGHGKFRPILDSGFSRFSSDTKRYFFFLWHKPEALEMALQELDVQNVILDRETFLWAPTLHHLRERGWVFVRCDETGMLFERRFDYSPNLNIWQRDEVSEAISRLTQNGKITAAFAYSTLLDDPVASLNILERYSGAEWPDGFFNQVCVWVNLQPPEVIQKFLAGDHPHSYPLVDAILSARLGSDAYEKYLASNPPGPRPWYWKALEVRNALLKGDHAQAKSIFGSISPVPISSTTYYELWHEVRGPNANEADLDAYGKWQTWDASAKELMDSMSTQLNARLKSLPQPQGL